MHCAKSGVTAQRVYCASDGGVPQRMYCARGRGALQVEDLSVAEELISQPYHNFTHPTYGTVMRMMEDPVNFGVQIGTTSKVAAYDNYS